MGPMDMPAGSLCSCGLNWKVDTQGAQASEPGLCSAGCAISRAVRRGLLYNPECGRWSGISLLMKGLLLIAAMLGLSCGALWVPVDQDRCGPGAIRRRSLRLDGR
jgi:hypothetical protein